MDSTVVREVRLRDGTVFIGLVRALSEDSIRFETLAGHELECARESVQSMSAVRGHIADGAFRAADPADSRLFFGPAARILPHGHGYAGVYELFFPSGAVGIADRAMISGGFSVFPGVDVGDQFGFVSPKLQLFRTESVAAAVGAFAVTAGGDGATSAYAVLTGGNDVVAVTGGLAHPFVETDDDLGNTLSSTPVFTTIPWSPRPFISKRPALRSGV